MTDRILLGVITAAVGALAILAECALYFVGDRIAENIRSTLVAVILFLIIVALVTSLILWGIVDKTKRRMSMRQNRPGTKS